MPVSTWISAVYDPAVTPDYITHLWDANGRVATRTIGSMTGMVTETTSFGYHDRLLNLVLTKPAPTEIPCPLTELNEGNNYSLKDSWTYRYGPGGIREQKRLMTSPQHDRMPCGVAPWVAYVLSPGGQQLAVYHGRQVSVSSCTPAGFGPYERRVQFYPVEFRSYGPDGINVIFERNAGGVMTKRFVTTNNQGSIVSVTDNAGYEASAVYDNFGTPTNAYTRRTGWLDRERDFETSPLSDKHKLYDLEARKYDASTGQFLSVDPLWMQFLSSSSYVYCEGDPVNGTDPSGLADLLTPDPPERTSFKHWQQQQLRVDEGQSDEERAREAQRSLLVGPDNSLILANNEAWKEYISPRRNSSELKGGEKRPHTSREVVVYGTRLRNGDTDNWYENSAIVAGMFLTWVSGSHIADNPMRFENDQIADAMRDSWGVKGARAEFYKKHLTSWNLDGADLPIYPGRFGIPGAVSAGLDPVEQFVGSCTINVTVENNMLRFSLWNRTSFQSFLFGIGPHWFGGPMGNMDQTYIFYEPIRSDWQWRLK